MNVYYNPWCNSIYVVSYFNWLLDKQTYMVLCEYSENEPASMFSIRRDKWNNIVNDLTNLGEL